MLLEIALMLSSAFQKVGAGSIWVTTGCFHLPDASTLAFFLAATRACSVAMGEDQPSVLGAEVWPLAVRSGWGCACGKNQVDQAAIGHLGRVERHLDPTRMIGSRPWQTCR